MSMPDTISWIIESTINPIIAPGQFHGDLDAKRAGAAHVVRVDDEYRMYHWGTSADDYNRILLATSPAEQPNAWAPQGVILERQPDAPYNFQGPSFPHVVRVDEQKWLLYFAGWGQPRPDGKLANTTGVAVSEDGGSHFSYISDHPVLHRLDGNDIPRCAAQHLLSLTAHSLGPASCLVDRDNGRFINYNALASSIHTGIGRPEINGQITREQRKQSTDTQQRSPSLASRSHGLAVNTR